MGKRTLSLLACALLLLLGVTGFAQESAVKGSLGGVVMDPTGAVIPGAKVTLTGVTGSETVMSDGEGNFMFTRLVPGAYSLKVEKQGFKVAEAKGIEVSIGRTSALKMTLQTGAVSEVVEVSATALTVDTTSTATSANLSDAFYASVPVPRNVASLFYVAPGVVDGGMSGRANPSMSGGSGLENLYIADGVNITDAAFGGLGIFSRVYGSVGSGVNLSFIKEVQVKTSGIEPQYGISTGGVVTMVTKSGGNAFHGMFGAFAAPAGAQASHPQIDTLRNRHVGADRFTANGPGTGLGVGPGAYDVSGEIGGYIPGFKNNLFFFGSYNPTLNTDYSTPPQFAGTTAIEPTQVPVGLFTEFNGKPIYTRAFINNYAGKLTFKINDMHSIESSVFGDPASTNNTAFRVVNAQDTSVFSSQKYGTRNFITRYNGSFSPTWLVNASIFWNHSDFTETPESPNTFGVVDRSTVGLSPTLQGLGFVENYNADNFAYTVDTSKVVHFGGQHTISIGFNNEFLNYNDLKSRTGGRFAVPDVGAARDASIYGCTSNPNLDTSCPLGFMTNASFSLIARSASCTLCPLYRTLGGATVPVALSVSRGEYGPPSVATEGLGYAVYGSDNWTINKYVSVVLGLRWEQYQMKGVALKYTFTDNWAPHLGVIVDPWGDRKSKVFVNFARMNYQMPLDAAIRSLSSELDLTGLRFAPVVNADNSITVIPDAAHLLNAAAGGTGGPAFISAQAGGNLEGFVHGTKMQFQDEWMTGFEREMGHGIVFSARYVDRRLRRIVEDMGGVSPEAALAGIPQIFAIGNPSSHLDAFTNEPTPTIGNLGDSCASGIVATGDANGNNLPGNQQACFPASAANPAIGSATPDGIPDGFANPVRQYQAAEFEVNKSFSRGWLMRANYRVARLRGNYEGAFRNDNGQTDPSISSLFDFRTGVMNLLGDQFAIGPLNTDRRQVASGFFSYTFDRSKVKGLTLGTGIHVASGTPVSEFADHPVYGNAGEVPLGGRGKLGRTPVGGAADLHAEYARKLNERYSFRAGADLFNVASSVPVSLLDQNRDLSFSAPNSNLDFQTPVQYQNPFYARFSLKVVF
jgi:Carboxypeptidase regulatory-like domain